MPARIASVFVLLVLSAAASFFPLLAVNYKFFRIPDIVIFVTRYFGSGVIVATAFIHLLGEAQTSLSHPCIGKFFQEYSWASAFSLMGVVVMFTIEAFTHRRMNLKNRHLLQHTHVCLETGAGASACCGDDNSENVGTKDISVEESREESGQISNTSLSVGQGDQTLMRALMNIYLLEFGIVFHSVFVGLSLAIAGKQFQTLFVAISFHQFFEGMGLGARFATAKWPAHQKRMPWYLCAIYSVTTPIGIAAGLGVRHFYLENSPVSLIVVGVFDGFCSGLLIYNSLIELMAHDFTVDPAIKNVSIRKFALAYGTFLLGIMLMALIGTWA